MLPIVKILEYNFLHLQPVWNDMRTPYLSISCYLTPEDSCLCYLLACVHFSLNSFLYSSEAHECLLSQPASTVMKKIRPPPQFFQNFTPMPKKEWILQPGWFKNRGLVIPKKCQYRIISTPCPTQSFIPEYRKRNFILSIYIFLYGVFHILTFAYCTSRIAASQS